MKEGRDKRKEIKDDLNGNKENDNVNYRCFQGYIDECIILTNFYISNALIGILKCFKVHRTTISDFLF